MNKRGKTKISERALFRYGLVVMIFSILLISLQLMGDRGFTGFAIFSQSAQGDFDEGSYANTEWNGSDVVLSSGVSGSYVSKVFDATNDAVWNNLSWVGNEPSVELLFAVDAQADILNSVDGVTWSLVKADYNDGNGATYMVKNSSNDLFILDSPDLWSSVDSGVNWVLVNDDFNPGDSNNGLVIEIDGNEDIFIIDAGEEVFKSTDSGTSFTSINESFNGGTNAKGMTSDSSDNLYVVDGSANVWKSGDSGVSWSLVKDDYNGDGNGNDATDMTSNSSDDLFILHNQDVWYSVDSGVNWVLVNDDFNEGVGSSGQVIYVDENDNIFIVDGGEDVYKSTDLGISFSLLVEDYNGGNGNIFGMSSIIEDTTLDFQVKSCDDDACSGESWIDISDVSPQDLSLDNNRYFQYKVSFTSPDSGITPSLQSADLDYTPPESNPPSISYSSSTTEEGTYSNMDSINVGVDLSDASQIYSFINFDNSLVGFWKMDDDSGAVTDYSGYGNNGTNNGASYSVGGKFGSAMGFDGADTIDFAGAGNFERTDSFSVSVWVNSEPDEAGIIQRYDGTKGWALFTHASGTLILDIRHDGTNYIRRRSVNTVSDTTWKHVVFSYDGSSTLAGTHVYVNGELDDSASGSSDTLTDSISTGTSCKLGILHNYGNYRWIGDMDEVLIFNRTLSSEEVSNLYDASFYSKNFTGLDYGTYEFYAYAQDIYGNEAETSTRTVILSENAPPTINLAEPEDGDAYGYNESLSLNFSVSDADDNIESCWYSLDEGEIVFLAGCANISFDVSEGLHDLVVYVNDSLGLEASDSASFNVAVGAPTISLSSPIDSYLNDGNVVFYYTATDIDLESCELWGNFNGSFSRNQTDTEVVSGVEDSFSLELEDGEYKWNVWCNDSVGNSAFNGNKTFYIDRVNPDLTVSQPMGAKSSRTVSMSYVVSDDSPVSCWYNVYRGANLEVVNTSVDCALGSESFDVTVDADFSFNFYVNDSAGNENSTNTSFSVDTSSAPPVVDNGGSGGGGGGGGSGIVVKKSVFDITGLDVLEISSGEIKEISLWARNTNKLLQNDCKVYGKGEFSSWIVSSDEKDLNVNEKEEFVFNVEIPKGVELKEYDVPVYLKCQDVEESVNLKIVVSGSGFDVFIKEVSEVSGNKIVFSYVLRELSGSYQDVELVFSVVNVDGEEIASSKREIALNGGEEREEVIEMEIPVASIGEHNLVVSANSGELVLSDESSILMSGESVTGFASLFGSENSKKYLPMIVIVLLGGLLAFFVVRRIKKTHRHYLSHKGERKLK